MAATWPPRLKRAGWWLLDCIAQVGFSLGVWILCDLPAAIEAWKWKRQQRRAAMKQTKP